MTESELKSFIETQEKQHYDSLRNLFKWIIGSLSVIFSVGAAVIGINVYQIKSGISDDLREAKLEIATLKSDSKDQLAELRSRTDLQIDLIKREAQLEALTAVRSKVDYELSSPQVQQFIYSELRQNINNNLDQLVNESFGRASSDFNKMTREVSNLNTMFQYTIWNDVSKVRYLDSVSYLSPDKQIRDVASDLLKNVRDWYSSWSEFDYNTRYSIQYRKKFKETAEMTDEELRKHLRKIVFNESDSELVTLQFQALIDLYEGKLNMFEFQKLKNMK